ncbi:MAG: hypothetical protein M1821_005617 [Bathelium mastoideum]|nr:MAG: hypothetical protein M1821_005617 [Bathelium mastoideum]
MATSASQASLADASLWQEQQGRLNQLYRVEGKTLLQVKQIMENQYGFPETKLSTYETKMRELGLKKKLKAQDWVAIHRHLVNRVGRNSEVLLNGFSIPPRRLKKEIARNLKKFQNTGTGPFLVFCCSTSLPPDVSIVTPLQSPREALDCTPEPVISPGITQSRNLVPISDGNHQDVSIGPQSQFQILFNRTKKILASMDSSLPLPSSKLLIFDERFVEICNPILNNLPTLQLQSTLQGYLGEYNTLGMPNFTGPIAHESDHSFTGIREELNASDAVELGLLSETALVPWSSIDIEDTSRGRPASQLSPIINPIYAFSVVIYYLANDFQCSLEILELMHWIVNQVPRNLLEFFLRLDSPTAQASWSKLLDWAFLLEEENFFRLLMSVFTKDPDWIKRHGARALILAAWYDCHDVCEHLVDHGISQDWTSSFPPAGNFFTESGTRITARHYHPWRSYFDPSPDYTSSPLIEAAAEGNIRTVKVLLDRGADVTLRCEGCTAAGWLVYALKVDNYNREHRLGVLKLLLERGTDVNEPIWESPFFGGLGHGDPSKEPHSDETLLDEACLTHDSKLAELLWKYDKTPESLLTIAGIVSNAERGIKELQDYLHVAIFPRGLPRRRMREVSLYRCFGNPDSFSAMIQAGFDLGLPNMRGSFRCPEIPSILEELFSKMSIASLSKDTISRMAELGIEVRASLLRACLDAEFKDGLRYLLGSCSDTRGIDGLVIMAEAVWQQKFAFIPLLQSIGIEINGTLKVGNCDCPVLLLAAMRAVFDDHRQVFREVHIPPLEKENSGIPMLEFLVLQGANIKNCYPALRSFLHSESPDLIYTSCLEWFVDKGFDLPGESICDILIHRLKGRRSLRLLQSLLHRNVPIFSSGEPLKDHRRFTTNIHPLSFFILIKPGLDFISQALESGIDLNGTGRHIDTETPLLAAASTGNQELVLELISRGALPNGNECNELLQLACRNQADDSCHPFHLDLARYALKNGSNPNNIGGFWSQVPAKTNYFIQSRLERVYSSRSPLDVSYMMEGPHENVRSRSPLEVALSSQHVDARLIELLLDHGADVNISMQGQRILKKALVEADGMGVDKQRIVEMLIDRGARINERWAKQGTGGSETVLEAVCEYNGPDRIDLIKLLLNRGAKLSQRALEVACRYNGPGCINSVKLLLDWGAELDPPMDYDETECLNIACEAENIDLMKLLLDRGMDPNPRDSRWRGPLANAARSGDLAMAVLLLAAGAKVVTEDGYYSEGPLVAAATGGRLDMVALLIDSETRPKVFEDAISAARQGGYLSITSFIQRHVDASSSSHP